MFVALSRFTVANDMSPEVKSAFQQRPHLVDKAAGFINMEVMTNKENPSEFWLFTRWKDQQSYQVWHKSHAYQKSHQGIPKGLKLQPGSSSVVELEGFAQ